MRDAALLTPQTRPQLAETRRQHPTPPWMSPWPLWASQRGQCATDHRPSCHLTTRPTSSHWINSPSQPRSKPTVQRSPTMPARRQRVGQSMQSVPLVPVRLHPFQLRPAHDHARHRVPDTTPPWPCTATHRCTPATPHFAGHVTETLPIPTAPESHRHRPPVP
jgi:hypothetical protein